MDDTIVGLATPAGEGAIHVIRLSGKQAKVIVGSCFRPTNNKKWSADTTFTLHFGWFYDGETKIDQVLISRMNEPHSFSGEDILEINCHGGMVTARRIIEACLSQGARLAEAGEFSKRAFLNGKMDLVQAEAIVDIITSKTELSADLALAQLGGHLSSRINDVRQEILDILSYIEATIDFPEDEIDDIALKELSEKIITAKDNSIEIFKGSKTGKIIREGLSTVIAGRPNVGKSSLLNALLREERAIVTEIPGTTRDEIREYIKIGEVLLHLTDTAGIRESDDPVEMIGIERAWKALNSADVVLLLLDALEISSGKLTNEEKSILEDYADKLIVLINKIDVLPSYEFNESMLPPNVFCLPFSVKNRIGFAELEAEIVNRVFEGDISVTQDPILSNIRQIQAMENCIILLEKALEAVYANVPFDLVSIDIRAALEEISSITGHHVQEDLLDNIFSRFCIGK
ncbi:tRNA uridine-5-carboxymethylaminomethyl(34) synthesis GTPase MnmE [Dehalobacter sp. DCM]|uniref:tRNA uridine-5-carboxymethylaminomethyl(34) synthesis GTPase MnmE n=1 Tax=Dehalobacter sp. DCM TaxID=2907827 RepID=UPI003081697F|nr:tRNA uridine-5-carboxymethylaminomethyl(34) synthesis GTPase MnmE [Dehalobacter sp. DCM]